MRSPRNGNCSTQPSTRASNGLPLSGFTESQMPSTPPMLSTCMMSPACDLVRHVARVAEQRLAMAERADDHVAPRDLGHAAAGELERVVRRLVVEDLDDQHDAFLARNVGGGDAQLVAQAAGLRDRGDLVDDDGLHLLHGSIPRGAAAGQLRPARV